MELEAQADMFSTGSRSPGVSARRSRGIRRDLEVLRALTVADLRGRYGRGSGRFAKWILDPFALVGVYLLLVSFVLDRPGVAPGLSLACAVVPFQLTMMTVISGMSSIALRESIILNMPFRRTLLPASAVLTESVAFAASLALVALMMAVYGVAPTVDALWLPVVILVNVALALALSYPAALFGLWFQELRPFAVSVMRALFFVAPGLVPLAAISGRAAEIIKVNPFTGLFEAYRDVLLYGRTPSPWELLVPLAFAVVVFAVSLPVYRRDEGHFAKMLG